MTLNYTTDNGVQLEIQTVIDGIVVRTIDGTVKNHFTITGVADAEEIAKMFQKSAAHHKDMQL